MLPTLAVACWAASNVVVDWSTVTRVSKTITTLQVVSNPILDRTFTVNGRTFVNPIHDNAFASLAALEADMVRYVPWFPYPHVAVAELVRGQWDFTYILPMLEDFMRATHFHNHTTVINFSTQPCWLFNAADCSFPEDPNQSFFDYVRGNALLDPSARDLAAYYVRLFSWLIKGYFVDESGRTIRGGPAYSNLTYWELFNEAEHGYSPQWYNHDYDVVVSEVRRQVDTDHRIKWMGVGGAGGLDWVSYFLNRSNHAVSDIPLDFASVHYYAGCSNRTDPTTYTQFFSGADAFVESTRPLVAWRDANAPSAGLDFDELGVIMPDDNNPALPPDANLPDLYWNAAGGMYATLFAKLAQLGVEVLGHSQLAGSPGIPEWGIPLPQYPSVSLLDWRTGFGNARYWVLMLLLDHFAPGDRFTQTTTSSPTPSSACSTIGCGVSPGPAYATMKVRCCSGGTINAINFADYGLPVVNATTCAATTNPQCTSRATTEAYVRSACLGKSSCFINPNDLPDPCVGTVKSLFIAATCSGGGATVEVPQADPIFAQGIIAKERRGRGADRRKILLVNQKAEVQTVNIAGAWSTGTLYVVDDTSKSRGDAQGIKASRVVAPVLTLRPYATAVLVIDQ